MKSTSRTGSPVPAIRTFHEITIIVKPTLVWLISYTSLWEPKHYNTVIWDYQISQLRKKDALYFLDCFLSKLHSWPEDRRSYSKLHWQTHHWHQTNPIHNLSLSKQELRSQNLIKFVLVDVIDSSRYLIEKQMKLNVKVKFLRV